jgi:hypothetical protein
MSQGTLHVIDATGDTQTVWDSTVAEDVETVRGIFEATKEQGHLAYTVDEGGATGEVIRDFDPEAHQIVMTPQLVGG